MEKHEIELHDSWIWPDFITYEGDFYKFDRKIESHYHIGMYDKNEEYYYRSQINLEPTTN